MRPINAVVTYELSDGENKMKKEINVKWLNACPSCGESNVTARTNYKETDELLQGDDTVKCTCGEEGVIVVYDDVAECHWAKISAE